ncbi:MAG: hypothetical protein ACKOHK_07890 [Planctomycetia bacterium]
MEAVDHLEAKRDQKRDEQQEELARAERVEGFEGVHAVRAAGDRGACAIRGKTIRRDRR